MIQFNLLPDVKKEYVKAKRTKRLIITVSLASSMVAVGVVVVMFSVVNIAQKKHINDLSADIEIATSEIQSTENLDSILTVQKQLSILPELHTDKPELSRFFDYVSFATPANVKVSTLDLDMDSFQIVMSGSTDSIATINRFVDNLKAVRYSVLKGEDSLAAVPPFSEVVTTGLSGDNDSATFKINLVFDPVIFDNTVDIVMNIGTQSISTAEGSDQ